MLEKHILEAQAKALAYEEREDEKRKKICENPDDFGVPPAKSFFSHCLDDALLKEHGLLVPSDYYYKAKKPTCPMPKSELPDSHLRETVASRARNLAKSSMKSKLKSRTPGINDIEELHKSGSELSDDGPSLFNSDGSDVYFLNRFEKPIKNVTDFSQLSEYFKAKPNGTTPLTRVLKKVLNDNSGLKSKETNLLVVIVTDGEPTNDEGNTDIIGFQTCLNTRSDYVYTNIIACTDEDDTMTYLKDWDKLYTRLAIIDVSCLF